MLFWKELSILFFRMKRQKKSLLKKFWRVLELNASQNLTMVHMHGKDYESERAANTRKMDKHIT